MRRLAAAIVFLAGRAAAEPVALLATEPQGEETALYLVEPGAPLGAPVARFEHLEGASVQAAVVPGTRTVLAVADRTPAFDRSFASALVKLAPGAPPTWLCDRVVVASRPLITADGRVFVSRGRAGKPRDGELRVDDLTIDEIDPRTGRARTVHTMRGYLLYLAGASGDEIFVYRIRPDGADVIALSPTGQRTVVASLAPTARRFSVDEGGALRFETLDGRVQTVGTPRAARPRRATLLERRPGDFPVPFVVDEHGTRTPLPWPAGRRVTIAGFVP